MTTQYTTILKLALPVQGELSGTWGDIVNNNITQMVEQAVAGKATVNSWTGNAHTLTTADGTTAESRCAILELTDTGTALSGAGTVTCPTNTKLYIVDNNTAQIITVKTSGGTGVAVPVGKTMLVYCDGTNVVEGVTHANSLSLGTSTSTVNAIATATDLGAGGSSNSNLPTQLAVKTYVDGQIAATNELSEVLAAGNTTGSTDIEVTTAQKVQFRDSAIYINSSADGQLDLVADTEIQIAATTVDLNGNLDVSGTALVTGVLTTTAATVFNGGFASNADSTLGTDKKVQFRDAAIYINSSADGQLDIVADGEVQIATALVDINGNLDVSGTTNISGSTTFTKNAIASVAISGVARSSNTVTVTTSAVHGLSVNDLVNLNGVTDTSFNGYFTVTAVSSTTVFTFSQTAANASSSGGFTTEIVYNLNASGTALNQMNGPLNITANSPIDGLEITQSGAGNGLHVTGTTDLTGNLDISGTATGATSFATAAGGTFTTAAGNDLNLVYPDSRSLFIKEGSTTHVTVDNAGKVGINTTNPAQRFVVAEGTNQHGIELAPGSLSYIQAYDRATSDYGDLKIDAQTIQFGTDNGTERMRISSAGLVGIGTATPAAPLNVAKNGDGTIVRLLSVGIGEWDFSMGNSSTLTGVGAGALELLPLNSGTGSEFAIGQAGSSTAVFHVKSGSVLIGTSTVAYAGTQLNIGTTSDAESGVQIQSATDGTGYVLFGDGASAAAYRGQINYVHATDHMAFNTAGAEAMRLDSGGRLGVSNSSPANYTGSGSNTFVLGNSSSTTGSYGMTIVAGNQATSSIAFSDHAGDGGTSDYRGLFQYVHSDDSLRVFTASGERFRIMSGGDARFTLSADAVGTFQDDVGEVGSGTFCLQVANSAQSALKPLGFRAEDIRFATSGGERVRISADGEVTKPYQPAFSATVNAAQNNIATDSDVTIVFGAETFDVGSNFASNTFTAPVTGKYQLNLILRLDSVDTAANYYIVSFFTSNSQYRFIYDPGPLSGDPAYWATSLAVLADMDASDTAYITVNQSGGTAQTDITNAPSYQRFSGYLVA